MVRDATNAFNLLDFLRKLTVFSLDFRTFQCLTGCSVLTILELPRNNRTEWPSTDDCLQKNPPFDNISNNFFPCAEERHLKIPPIALLCVFIQHRTKDALVVCTIFTCL